MEAAQSSLANLRVYILRGEIWIDEIGFKPANDYRMAIGAGSYLGYDCGCSDMSGLNNEDVPLSKFALRILRMEVMCDPSGTCQVQFVGSDIEALQIADSCLAIFCLVWQGWADEPVGQDVRDFVDVWLPPFSGARSHKERSEAFRAHFFFPRPLPPKARSVFSSATMSSASAANRAASRRAASKLS